MKLSEFSLEETVVQGNVTSNIGPKFDADPVVTTLRQRAESLSAAADDPDEFRFVISQMKALIRELAVTYETDPGWIRATLLARYLDSDPRLAHAINSGQV